MVGTDLRLFTGAERKRNTVKFTKAGFPIQDYLREMREDRQLEKQLKQEEKLDQKAESPNEYHHRKQVQIMKDLSSIPEVDIV